MNMVNKATRVAVTVGDITRVCARPFFNGAASRRQRHHRAWRMAAVTLCVTLVMGVALVNTRFSLAVYLNGEEVGAAKSISDVPRIVSSAESQLTELLGYDYSLDGSLSLAASVGDGESGGEIEKALILSVDGVEEMYTVTVDGEVIGASANEYALRGMLNGILAGYTTDNTTSARFVEEITVSRGFVTDDTPQDLNAIRSLLAPEDGNGLLTVESVESTLRTEELQFETEVTADDALYEGDRRVITAGEPGSSLVTENVVLINGVEVSREKAGRVTFKAPVTEVVAVGTAPRPKTASYGEYIWPADGSITSFFGYRVTTVGSRDHKGLDIAGFKGQDIRAADGGEVTFSGQSGGYGLVVIIQHDNGEETVYGHCSELLVSEGERVYRGQVIAAMGRTGVASGVHCHFEIRVDGRQIDPLTRLGTENQ